MTAPTEPTTEEPLPEEPTVLTGAELDRAILAAMQEYTAARLARDSERMAAARADLFALKALRDAQSGA